MKENNKIDRKKCSWAIPNIKRSYVITIELLTVGVHMCVHVDIYICKISLKNVP